MALTPPTVGAPPARPVAPPGSPPGMAPGMPPPPSAGSSLLAPNKEVIEALGAAGRALQEAVDKAATSGDRDLSKDVEKAMSMLYQARDRMFERHKKKMRAVVGAMIGGPLARTPSSGGSEIGTPLDTARNVVRGIRGAA